MVDMVKRKAPMLTGSNQALVLVGIERSQMTIVRLLNESMPLYGEVQGDVLSRGST